jgi:spermidine synthase
MVLELVVGRLIGSYVGTTLYTWTIVISVVLAGIAVGNAVGGRLADRWASRQSLGAVLVLGGLASLGVLGINVLGRLSDLERVTSQEFGLVARMLAFSFGMSLLPCIVLGAVSPIVVKLAVRGLDDAGRTIGRIYAAGTVGSIVGTFASGFLLISWFGTRAVVWGVGMVLVLLGVILLLGRRWVWSSVALLSLVVITYGAHQWSWIQGPCLRETNYFCIKVREEERDGVVVRTLILDRLLHSYSSVDDPTFLVYGYEKAYAEVTEYLDARIGPLRTLFIGGGGYTFPRYMEAVFADSELDVIEIDPGVTEVAHQQLGLDRDTRIVTHNEDARMFLAREPDGAYDLIFGDAFNDYSVPYHLTTKEFNDRVAAWLADDGLYVVNIIDGPYGYFLRAYTQTLRKTFRNVYLVFSVESWRTAPRSTIVVIASDSELDVDALAESGPRVSTLLVREDEIDALLAEEPAQALRDRYAPVDQMLLPVFLDRVPAAEGDE